MTKAVEQIEHNGEMFALILRKEYSKPGVSFFTPNELSQQLAYMQHPAGKVIDAHIHNPVTRSVAYTQETLVIKRGRLRVDFFDEQRTYLESRELGAGDVILLVKGGHGFEVLEDLEMIEVKQGPYLGDQDKTCFRGKSLQCRRNKLAEMSKGLISNFEKYSAFYDLLYRDKDYAAEAEYVARKIRSAVPTARRILELGSGTGRHGRLLAAMGFDVHGIERSAEMVCVAGAASGPLSCETAGSFTCEVGDICTARLGRTFDAVISLFHVMSYQTTNRALRAVFDVVTAHLAPGGLFLFDVWHGPAVVSQGPSERVKQVADERYRVKRTAHPELDTNRSTVKVIYQMDCEDRQSGESVRFSEEHLMRYLFPAEVDLLAQNCGLRPLVIEEFLTGQPPSPSTWGVTYVLQR